MARRDRRELDQLIALSRPEIDPIDPMERADSLAADSFATGSFATDSFATDSLATDALALCVLHWDTWTQLILFFAGFAKTETCAITCHQGERVQWVW